MPLVAIPGLREAREREAQRRLLAFADVPRSLCGVEVLPLTPRMFFALELTESPFAVGGKITPAAVGMLVWIASVERSRPAPRILLPGWLDRRKRRIGAKVGAWPFLDAIHRCRKFVEEAFADGSGGGTSADSPGAVASGLAAQVDFIASQYGWPEAAILDTPVSRLFQYQRLAIRRLDPKAALGNPESDKAKADWLKSMNQSQEATQ